MPTLLLATVLTVVAAWHGGAPTKAGELQPDARDTRAVSISVDDDFGVAQSIAPGDQVDFFLVRMIDGQPISGIVLSNVRVLSLEWSEASLQMTVEVEVRQAQKLLLAQKVGRLLVMLPGMAPGDLRQRNDHPFSLVSEDVVEIQRPTAV